MAMETYKKLEITKRILIVALIVTLWIYYQL